VDGAAVDGGPADGGPTGGGPADGSLAPGTIRCGASACRPPGEACCVPADRDAGSLTAVITNPDAKCVPAEQCLPPSISLRCTTPSFCGTQTKGAICCVDHLGTNLTTTECIAPAACDFAGPHDILCDPGAVAASCPSPQFTRCATDLDPVAIDVFGICLP
jgi:hypothetical protein